MSDGIWKSGFRPSNGTGSDMFRVSPAGCASCIVDHDGGWHQPYPDDGDSCLIFMKGLFGEYPDEWERNTETGEQRCTGWRGPCQCTEGTTYVAPPADWPRGGDQQ